MTDPLTALTVGKITALAFQKFIESSSGELAKKFTTEALANMDVLLKRIWSKLQNKPRIEEVKTSIRETHTITPEQLSQISSYLQVAMDEDAQFAHEIRLLARDVEAGKLFDQSSMTQNIHDQAKGWQTKVEGGTAYIGEIHVKNSD